MILGLEFPPISHVVEWPTLFGSGAFAVNKVIILMWVSAAIAFTVHVPRRPQAGPRAHRHAERRRDRPSTSSRTASCCRRSVPDGLKFTPFLLTLFTFILTCNIWGLIPGVQMPVNARIALPMFMALLVYVIYHVVGVIEPRARSST